MKKLSKVMRRPSTQSLIMFDNVLDAEKVLQSPEIEALVKYFYDGYALSVVRIENPEKLHDYLREEQYRADARGGVMVYPVKAPFDELTSDTHSDQFSGPLYVQIITLPETVFDVLTITCHWSDGVFRNDYYVIGVIIDQDDLGAILK